MTDYKAIADEYSIMLDKVNGDYDQLTQLVRDQNDLLNRLSTDAYIAVDGVRFPATLDDEGDWIHDLDRRDGDLVLTWVSEPLLEAVQALQAAFIRAEPAKNKEQSARIDALEAEADRALKAVKVLAERAGMDLGPEPEAKK